MNLQNNAKAIALAASVLTLTVAAPASAGVVTFGNVYGEWSAAKPNGVGSISNGNDTGETSTIRWGTGTEGGGNRQSSYKFTGIEGSTADLGDGDTSSPLTLGMFQHNNWPITGTTLTGVTLTFFADILVDGVSQGQKSFDFKFTHVESPNEGGYRGACQFGGTSGSGFNQFGCADQVTITPNSLNNEFSVGNDTYQFEIAGFFANNTITKTYLTRESAVIKKKVKTKHGYKYEYETKEFDNKAYIVAKVKMITSAVPEPSTWAMMIVGFGAVGSMVRANRRRLAVAV